MEQAAPDPHVVRDLAAKTDLDEEFVRAAYGPEVLAMVQAARALALPADTQLEESLQASSDIVPEGEHHLQEGTLRDAGAGEGTTSGSGVWPRRFEGDMGDQ